MIYLVEDDENIRELVEYSLCGMGLETKSFSAPSQFHTALRSQLPSLILLDIMLPEEDGLSILARLKSDPVTENIPVILLTAKGSEIDKVRGFEAGADDYIQKPFGIMELVARVRARLRAASRRPPDEDGDWELGDICVCPKKHTVRVCGKQVTLTRKEFDMLCMLLENKDTVLTRDQILNKIWGYAFDGESRTVDVHIRTLRQKLGGAGELIKTVRGIGYKISENDDE